MIPRDFKKRYDLLAHCDREMARLQREWAHLLSVKTRIRRDAHKLRRTAA